jgi:hypothetical protein
VVKSQEGGWFTIFGPMFDQQQADELKSGRRAFYFSATIINGNQGGDYDLCSFVIGNRPDVVLQCPEE